VPVSDSTGYTTVGNWQKNLAIIIWNLPSWYGLFHNSTGNGSGIIVDSDLNAANCFLSTRTRGLNSLHTTRRKNRRREVKRVTRVWNNEKNNRSFKPKNEKIKRRVHNREKSSVDSENWKEKKYLQVEKVKANQETVKTGKIHYQSFHPQIIHLHVQWKYFSILLIRFWVCLPPVTALKWKLTWIRVI
jgi:hypothetical protein